MGDQKRTVGESPKEKPFKVSLERLDEPPALPEEF
jgi:hypothetical protein